MQFGFWVKLSAISRQRRFTRCRSSKNPEYLFFCFNPEKSLCFLKYNAIIYSRYGVAWKGRRYGPVKRG